MSRQTRPLPQPCVLLTIRGLGSTSHPCAYCEVLRAIFLRGSCCFQRGDPRQGRSQTCTNYSLCKVDYHGLRGNNCWYIHIGISYYLLEGIVNSLSNSQETKFYNRKRKLQTCTLNNNSFFSKQRFRCSEGGGGPETRTRPQTESGWGFGTRNLQGVSHSTV